ncbi:helix-turn-helix transcriptional regulator [Arenibacter sp. M-2]|uniref:helix-turn-helix transcriptional regulator n=1 Tax=unclassified Arenibacter TaxID=2615047 RepID=UPI0011B4E097|nr:MULTISPECIES: helix-turn-helix transcriptional regulator [unclassified Arenibacter]MDL5512682.1 helix-turn-helix transcriptional regulator [Arenibacter sp. M-2]
MKKQSGTEYFLNQLSNLYTDLSSMEAASLKKRLVLFPNQAVSIYDYTNFNLRYADGFEIFGMKNEEITMLDIFNTAIPEHREVCGELSGKLIKLAKENVIDPDLHLLNITYAGQHKNGDKMHILLQGKIFDVTRDEKIKSACTIMTYLPHLKPPKIVSWSVHGSSLNNIDELLDKNIVNNHHIREREKEILILISDGQTMNEIGNDLNISSRTVEKHLENLRFRFNCQNTPQLVAFAKDIDLL